MLDEREKLTQHLNNRIVEAAMSSNNYFSLIGSESEPIGRLAVSLIKECSIHVLAFSEVALYVNKGLIAWSFKHHSAQLSKIDQLQWDIAHKSVGLLILAIEIDRTQEYIELSKEIGKSLAVVVGSVVSPLGILKEAVELSEKIAKIGKTSKTGSAPFRDTGKLLTRWEVYMMRGLLASQYAVVATDSILGPASGRNLEYSLAELGQDAMLKAKQFVAGSILACRGQMPGDDLGIRFPECGMWPIG